MTVKGEEYNIVRNEIILEDNLLGIIDNDETHEIVDVEVSEISYIKSNQ
jgi:hypothetical protein